MDEVTIVSYNCHSCVGSDGHYSVDRISNLLRSQNPDIVCLQEIEVNHTRLQTRIWSTPHNNDQPRLIADSLGMSYISFAPAITSVVVEADRRPLLTRLLPTINRETHGGFDGGKFGICILSRFPIGEERRIEFKIFGKKTRRNALACLVQIPNGTSCWIVNTHLGCHTGGEQYQQSLELSRFVESLSNEQNEDSDLVGVILCGDFNSLPNFRSIKAIESGMQDAWKGNGVGSGYTFPSTALFSFPANIFQPFFRLDYIFTKALNGNAIQTLSIDVVAKGDGKEVEVIASDHLALAAHFCIKDKYYQFKIKVPTDD